MNNRIIKINVKSNKNKPSIWSQYEYLQERYKDHPNLTIEDMEIYEQSINE